MLYKYYINLIFKYLDLMITLCQIKNIRSNLRMYTFTTKSNYVNYIFLSSIPKICLKLCILNFVLS